MSPDSEFTVVENEQIHTSLILRISSVKMVLLHQANKKIYNKSGLTNASSLVQTAILYFFKCCPPPGFPAVGQQEETQGPASL